MKIGELAARDVVSVGPADSLRNAARVMVDAEVGSAVVLADGALAGIVTERDVLRAVADAVDADDMAAGAVMTREVVTVEPDWEVYEAAAEMAARRMGGAARPADLHHPGRRELQRYLLALRGDRDIDLSDLLALLVGSWSLAVDLPPAAAALRSLPTEVYAALRDAVLAELPELQRAVHPSPGWRRR